jgi:DNA-directed RNA polymerase subunit beta'
MVLDMTLRDIERVLYFEAYVVTDPGMTPLKKCQIMSEDDYAAKYEEYGDDFTAFMGAEGIRELLRSIDIDRDAETLRVELKESKSEAKIKKYAKRLKVLEAFQRSGIKPDWMIMEVLPVLPPELRPLVPLDGGRFATSDLNDLYRRVINRNNRLKRLMELRSGDHHAQRKAHAAGSGRLAAGQRPSRQGHDRRQQASAEVAGRHDQGQGRSFPSEPAGQARRLLGPFGHRGGSAAEAAPVRSAQADGAGTVQALHLQQAGTDGSGDHHQGRQEAGRAQEPVVWDILEEVIREHPVMLNRAPTLHRLGIQAFEPVLIEGKAIQLHPLVCAAFNADFDGDQMAVHVPLSIEAQMEARTLMLASNNMLFPPTANRRSCRRRISCWVCTTRPAKPSTARAKA